MKITNDNKRMYTSIDSQWKMWLQNSEFEQMRMRLEHCALFDRLAIKATKVLNVLYAIYGKEVSSLVMAAFDHFGCVPQYAEFNDAVLDLIGIVTSSGDNASSFTVGNTMMELSIEFGDDAMFAFLLGKGVSLIDPTTNEPVLLRRAIASTDAIAIIAIERHQFYHLDSGTIKETSFLFADAESRLLLTVPKIKALLRKGYTCKRLLYHNCVNLAAFQWCMQYRILDKMTLSAFFVDLMINYIHLRMYEVAEFIYMANTNRKSDAKFNALLKWCIMDRSEAANATMLNLYQLCRNDNSDQIWLDTGCTPLQEAARAGDLAKCRMLVSVGESPVVTDGYTRYTGRNALYYARQSENDELVQYLLELEKIK